jgi:phosphohistidine phosphatase
VTRPESEGRLLWLLRHAKTRKDPPRGGTDHERALTTRGHRDAVALGAHLGSAGDRLGFEPAELPGTVLSSTARRTVQTVELVLADMAAPPPVTYLRSLYTASPDDVLGLLGTVDDDVDSVMVVGHNPTAEDLAFSLLAADDPAGRSAIDERGFPTCALGVYRLEAKRWMDATEGSATLVGLFTPPF